MSNELTVIVHAHIKPGSHNTITHWLPAFENDVQANEPDTVAHQAARAGDELWFIETYTDSDALLNHIGRDVVQDGLGVLMENTDIESVLCCGAPSEAAREVLDGLGAKYAIRLAGFARREATITS